MSCVVRWLLFVVCLLLSCVLFDAVYGLLRIVCSVLFIVRSLFLLCVMWCASFWRSLCVGARLVQLVVCCLVLAAWWC